MDEKHHVEGFSVPAIALSRCATVAFDLVLVDYMMPGMNGDRDDRGAAPPAGYEHVPIIMITART